VLSLFYFCSFDSAGNDTLFSNLVFVYWLGRNVEHSRTPKTDFKNLSNGNPPADRAGVHGF
jgi:hypothetical protein